MGSLMKNLVLGVDVGGTNIKIGIVNNEGLVIDRNVMATKGLSTPVKLIDAISSSLQSLIKNNRLAKNNFVGIGMGLPGLVDFQKGFVHFLVNIPGWKKVPLKAIMQKRLGIPVFVDNDANVITLGEWQYGAGRGFQNLVCLTLGTGVGGGLILANAIYRGPSFSAGEIGHIPLTENGPACKCGGRGCLERTVGNRYLLKRARTIFHTNISLEEVTLRARSGEQKAVHFWHGVGEHLGHALTGVVNLLNPQCFIIGGGVANAGAFIFPAIRATLKRRAMRIPGRLVKIVKARLGADAGIMGTQVLVQYALR